MEAHNDHAGVWLAQPTAAAITNPPPQQQPSALPPPTPAFDAMTILCQLEALSPYRITAWLHFHASYLLHNRCYHHHHHVNNPGRTPTYVPSTNGSGLRYATLGYRVAGPTLQALPLPDGTRETSRAMATWRLHLCPSHHIPYLLASHPPLMCLTYTYVKHTIFQFNTIY
ncbi:hypothetical protein Pmani_031244 [Petrolisthes manimaculis]|uniref:Uncharacterized protein n=1 Tax=Petrolisthes manimaculis TaxID=1843537 RepID=A0AAE1NU36_9EUCA|nr:hypothetical protein Pmani_031244 [Petrolisthes manimaculis]